MSFCSSASGCACLNDWDQPLAVNQIVDLLLDVKRAATISGTPVILILVIRESMPAPGSYLLSCLRAALPALLDCCEQLLVVVEGSTSDRTLIRGAFQTTRRTAAKQTSVQLFESLSTAFTHAQRFAPHDILELQRQVMHRSLASRR